MAETGKPNNWLMVLVVGGLISGVIAVAFVGSQQSQRNQQNLIDNLPAVLSRIEIIESQLVAIQGSTLSRGEIEAKLEAFAERQSATEGQLTRRFNEVVREPLGIIRDDAEKNEDAIARLMAEVAALKALVETLQP